MKYNQLEFKIDIFRGITVFTVDIGPSSMLHDCQAFQLGWGGDQVTIPLFVCGWESVNSSSFTCESRDLGSSTVAPSSWKQQKTFDNWNRNCFYVFKFFIPIKLKHIEEYILGQEQPILIKSARSFAA